MNRKPVPAPGSRSSNGRRRQSRNTLLIVLALLFTALVIRPTNPGAQARSAVACPVFYKELGKRLSSLPRDAGRRAKVRTW